MVDDGEVLVADIGGTHTRFALADRKSCSTRELAVLATADYRGPEEAAASYLASHGDRAPRWAAFALAAPVGSDSIRLTNHPWIVTPQSILKELRLDGLVLINDFAALALAVPLLAPQELQAVGGGRKKPAKPLAVLGPGTGLGVSVAVPCGDGWSALAGEGGHVSLAPGNALESEILACVRAEFPHVSAERLISGTGLPLLRRALARVSGQQHELSLSTPEICRAAIEAKQRCLETQTLDLFCALLGSVAGNLALTVGAQGGVYLGGGIVPRLGEYFFHSEFRLRFEAKGRFSEYLTKIPTAVITAESATLRGAVYAFMRCRDGYSVGEVVGQLPPRGA